MGTESGRCARLAAERLLSGNLVELRPDKIASLLRSIADHVMNAASRANWQGEILQLPHPGRWSRHPVEFVKTLEPSLRELLNSDQNAPFGERQQNSGYEDQLI